jgi:hypothetical protein
VGRFGGTSRWTIDWSLDHAMTLRAPYFSFLSFSTDHPPQPYMQCTVMQMPQVHLMHKQHTCATAVR